MTEAPTSTSVSASDVSQLRKLVIGTRESKLAMWQAQHTHSLLSNKFAASHDMEFSVLGMTTHGDRDQNTELSKFSDKGIFTKELDVALLQHTIDCAVHCVKDLPTAFHADLCIASYLPRGVPNDVLLIDKQRHPNSTCVSDLPAHSVIGTGSLRRQSLLRSHAFSNYIKVRNIRGNLNTRLHKLVQQHLYDAIVLAETGVRRLGWMMDAAQIAQQNADIDSNALLIRACPLSYPYAIGQGALAIMCRAHDQQHHTAVYQALQALNDFHCEMSCELERSLLRTLEGGCKVPIATQSGIYVQCAHCLLWNDIRRDNCQACVHEMMPAQQETVSCNVVLYLYGLVLSVDGSVKIEATEFKQFTIEDYDRDALNERTHVQYGPMVTLCRQVGMDVAHRLQSQGAQEIIDEIKKQALTESNDEN